MLTTNYLRRFEFYHGTLPKEQKEAILKIAKEDYKRRIPNSFLYDEDLRQHILNGMVAFDNKPLTLEEYSNIQRAKVLSIEEFAKETVRL